MISHPLLEELLPLVRLAFPRFDYLGKYRYRLVQLNPGDDRVQLQAVRKLAGLPDLLPIQIVSGMAGLSAKLELGAIVYVEFAEGDPKLPIVTGFSPKGQPGFLPVNLLLDAATEVRLGASSASVVIGADAAGPQPLGRKGDPVAIGTLTVAGSGVVLQFTPAGGAPGPPGASVTLTGSIAEGSPLARSA